MNWIDTLPDELLTHILSFNDTKEAVQTCLVSKKWRHSWAFLPVLKFDIKDWVDRYLNDEEKQKEREVKFENYLNGVLKNLKCTQLDIFVYKNVLSNSEHEISLEFLNRVVQLNPRVVWVDVNRVNQMDFPDQIFSCTSLEKLHLSIYPTRDVTILRPKEVHLRSLKTLMLVGVMFSADDGFIKKLVMGCPGLENLSLQSCQFDISEISSNMLKILVIVECYQTRRTQISCPNLVHLFLQCSDETSGFELKNMTSLQYAGIFLVLEDSQGGLNMLNSLSNVSELTLVLWSYEFKEKLEKDISECCTFHNLLKLNIDYCDVSLDKELVACFLKHSPHLQDLSFYIDDSAKNNAQQEANQEELENVAFKRDYIKTVRIVRDGHSVVTVDRLISILHAHIASIGEIQIR